MDERLRIVIFEDEDLYRALLIDVLKNTGEFDVVGAFGDAIVAMDEVFALHPDVALLDIDLGGNDTGVQIGLKLRQGLPDMGIVLLSNYDEPGLLKLLPRQEMAGWSYLLKRSVADVDVLIRAILGSQQGLVVLDPFLVKALAPVEGTALDALTSRQMDIITLISQGYSNSAIAAELRISPKSVENYITQLYQVLGIDTNESGTHPRVRATLLFIEGHQRL